MYLSPASEHKLDKIPVYQSKATYYNPVTGKWQEGVFTLHPNHIEFMTAETDKESQFHLSLPLCTISGIQKKQSRFIYAAVVLIVGSESHWFASFFSRDSVYNLLEIFWHNALFSRVSEINSPKIDLKNCTPLGKELLSILYESEKTLIGAATALEEQGKQLNEAQESVEDINSDLLIAEKFVNSMKFLPSTSKAGTGITQSEGEEQIFETRKKKYKVTFSAKNSINDVTDWASGILLVSNELILLDAKENPKFSIPKNEMQLIKVLSPWELCITQTFNGKETQFNIMCPMLLRILKVLEATTAFQTMIVHDKDDDSSSICKSNSCSSSLSMVSAASSPSSPVGFVAPDIKQISEQMKAAQSSGSLMDEEVEQISMVLSNLHILAAEVGKEQQSQMEQISRLVTDVDKTELRMNVNNKKIKKLT